MGLWVFPNKADSMNLSVTVQRQIDLFSQVTWNSKVLENQDVIPNALVVHEITHLQFPSFHFPEADEGGNAWPNVAKMLALARPFWRICPKCYEGPPK